MEGEADTRVGTDGIVEELDAIDEEATLDEGSYFGCLVDIDVANTPLAPLLRKRSKTSKDLFSVARWQSSLGGLRVELVRHLGLVDRGIARRQGSVACEAERQSIVEALAVVSVC